MQTRLTRRTFINGATLACLLTKAPTARASTPRSPFGPLSTAEEVTAALNLTGLTAVITGCNSGIGYETLRVLALRGAHVIGTARTPEKARDACNSVRGKATPVVLELADFTSVATCADQLRALAPTIDILVLNAGVSLPDWQQVNGIERHFVVNHLGHFILANRLLDRVTAAKQGRVVVVGSRQHRNVPSGGIQFDKLSGEGWSAQGYGHSKLANGLFSLELAKRLRNSRATSNCLHPGAARTNILRHLDVSAAQYPKSVEQGAATQCYVATSPALAGVTGEYFVDCNPADQSEYQRDAAMAAKLWDVSADLTRAYLPPRYRRLSEKSN